MKSKCEPTLKDYVFLNIESGNLEECEEKNIIKYYQSGKAKFQIFDQTCL